MGKVLTAILLIVGGVLNLRGISSGQEAGKFRHILTIYADAQGKAIRQPEGIACTDQLLLIADAGNGRLLRFALEEGVIKGGTEIKASQLPYPIKVQVDSKGEIFALDGKTRRIVHLGPGGEFRGFLAFKGLASGAEIIPKSMKIDPSDSVYVLDVYGARVIKVSAEGDLQKQINFPSRYGFISDLTVDETGDVFLVDSARSMVYGASKDAKAFLPLTESLEEYMAFPTSLTMDGMGNMAILDQNSGTLVRLGRNGTFRDRKFGLGWDESFLYYPSQACVNRRGELYIADRSNNRVQMFQ